MLQTIFYIVVMVALVVIAGVYLFINVCENRRMLRIIDDSNTNITTINEQFNRASKNYEETIRLNRERTAEIMIMLDEYKKKFGELPKDEKSSQE